SLRVYPRIELILLHVIDVSLDSRHQERNRLSCPRFRSNKQVPIQRHPRDNRILHLRKVSIPEDILHTLNEARIDFILIFGPFDGLVSTDFIFFHLDISSSNLYFLGNGFSTAKSSLIIAEFNTI